MLSLPGDDARMSFDPRGNSESLDSNGIEIAIRSLLCRVKVDDFQMFHRCGSRYRNVSFKIWSDK